MAERRCHKKNMVLIYLRLRRKMLVEDLIDLEVRMTMRTRTFPITPTARTRLGEGRQWWW